MSSRQSSVAPKPSDSNRTPPPAVARSVRPSPQTRERRTEYIMIGFGLLLGGLELFIVFHYV